MPLLPALHLRGEAVASCPQYVETGDVRLVFRNLAFLGDESHWAAVAASLAADQNMFWPFHDYLFANYRGKESGAFRIDRLLEMGEAVGLDMELFREGLQLENARQRFAEIEAEARQDAYAIGVNATPTVTVDGVPLQAPDFDTRRRRHRHRAGQVAHRQRGRTRGRGRRRNDAEATPEASAAPTGDGE